MLRNVPILSGSDDGEESGEDHRLAGVAAKAVSATSAQTTNGHQHNGNGSTQNGSSSQHGSHAANGHANGKVPAAIAQRLTPSLKGLQPVAIVSEPTASRNQQFAKFQSDAPSCSNCGAITVRNGNCYLCHNCGTSHGCS